MNKDLIKKLIKLANNNPNENEANLAARKVCQMLTDHTFEVIKTAADKVGVSGGNTGSWVKPNPIQYTYWDESADIKDIFEEFMKGDFHFNYGRRGGKTEAQKEAENRYKYGTWKDTSNNEKKEYVCNKCHNRKVTRFRGPENIWVCMECRGKEYQSEG